MVSEGTEGGMAIVWKSGFVPYFDRLRSSVRTPQLEFVAKTHSKRAIYTQVFGPIWPKRKLLWRLRSIDADGRTELPYEIEDWNLDNTLRARHLSRSGASSDGTREAR